MEREFAFKEAKQSIKVINDLVKRLTKAIQDHDDKRREADGLFFALESSNYFSIIANSELQGKDIPTKNTTFQRMLVSINKYVSGNDFAEHAKELLNQINNDTSDAISTLTPGANPILWLFSSGRKKQDASIAYAKLEAYKNSYICEEARKTVESINNLARITEEETQRDFLNNKSKYEKAIKEIVGAKGKTQKVKAISDLVSRYQSIIANVNIIQNDLKNAEEDIKQGIERLVAFEIIDILKAIPIEELNREKKGIRIKPLREAGYTNMAEIPAANVYNLSSVHGISQDNAYTIKRIADDYAKQARKGIKIKLSYDNRNKAASEVVKRIYAFKQKKSFLKEIDKTNKKYDSFFYQAFSIFDEVGSGRFWEFYNDEYKKQVKTILGNFGIAIHGGYGQTITQVIDEYKLLKADTSLENAWNDFKNYSIDYYNIIEEICPGVLGTDDSLYGLPEELAKEIQDECFFPDGLLCTLRRYQEWGVKYILHQERVLLGDEMGLGKTVQAIATMVSLRNTGATHFVVVCPASVITNWEREIRKHSKLEVMKAHGSAKASTVKAWLKKGGVVVTTFESTSAFELDPYFRFSQMVVDEAHYIKNKNAARTTRTIELSRHAERILFMTGTALENNVDEMISLIKVLKPSIAQKISGIAFMSTAPQFRKEIAPVYYRRKREDVLTELPDKIESEEWCTMSKEEEDAYEKAVLSKNYMSARRVSWDVNDLGFSSKMNRLKEIIEEAKNDDRKILVFSFFLDTITKIAQTLGTGVCLNPINGSVHPKRRQEIIDEFDNAPAGTVLCAQIQSGGTGLNIQSASVVIICEPQLKPSIENQAISRAYRMGQSRNVQVFRLLCENTIDEKILNLLKEKQEIFDAFADKSVAAQNVEIDDKSLGDIIKEEIERINQKRGNQPTNEEVTPVEKWERAKDTYTGAPVSVTSRMKSVAQPNRGGYINPKDMESETLKTDYQLKSNENISPALIGLAVDYLTRFMLEKDVIKAFKISLMGAKRVQETSKAGSLLLSIRGLDDISIISAIKMVGYDVAARGNPMAYSSVDLIEPDSDTIENVRIMVNRSLSFFEKVGPILKFGYTFEGGYTKVIGSGDGDFMTKDTLWDFKVSKNEPTKEQTFQLLIYYIMGLHSQYPEYEEIKYLGIYNPRSNKLYRYSTDKIPKEVRKRIEEEVIGY